MVYCWTNGREQHLFRTVVIPELSRSKKRIHGCHESSMISGGPSGARTPNLLIKSQLLYQLS
jgi:hypothetical protein